MSQGASRGAVLDAFRRQVDWCVRLGSPFTARVLTLLADDIASGGIAADLVGDWAGDPIADALALRLAGALHALVLQKAAPALASLYPPAVCARELGPALGDALSGHRSFVESFLRSPPQTNEVGRSGVLLGGFLLIARETGLRLRTLEIGASAGLNSLWDRYRYRLGGFAWGDPASAVELAPDWDGPPPPDASLEIARRRACDLRPVDVADPAQTLRLSAFIWPDQPERLARLAGAIEIARRDAFEVERADAADWARARLSEPAGGTATVLFHSIMWHYMPDKTRADLVAILEQAGARATAEAPLAWLRFEPPAPTSKPELRLTLWPGGRDRMLATAQAHGGGIRWGAGE